MNKKRAKRLQRINTPEVMMDVNTTPLIDVMLVLLVMLIITIPIQLHAVNLEMPVGVPPNQANKPQIVQIDIDARNVIISRYATGGSKKPERKRMRGRTRHWQTLKTRQT